MKRSSSVPSKITLENGIRILIDSDTRFETASIAISILGGLRSETPQQVGITHLLEHLLFKRTETRTPLEIAKTMDRFGGTVNGYTDADNLCLHADVPVEKISDAIELFADMLLTPSFSQDDFDNEREVVRQEMLELADDPGDTVYRTFCEMLWPDSMLALPVCGTPESLAEFSPQVLRQHLMRTLVGGRVLIGIGGGVDASHCEELLRKNFSCLPAGEFEAPKTPETSSGVILTERSVSQVHFIIGARWPDLSHPKHTAAAAIIAALGEGMSSRLFQKLREERGLVYDIDCSSESFIDTASFEISGVVERSNLEQVLEIVQHEIKSIRDEGVRPEELAHICEVYEAEIAMERDSAEAKMWRAMETEVLYGRFVSSEEDLEALRAVTPEDCMEVLNSYLAPGGFVVSFAGNVAGLEINDELRRWCTLLQ